MGLTENNDIVMPVQPMNGGFGGGLGDGAWLWVLLLFAFMGNGFGGGFGGDGLYPWMNQMQSTQSGFDQAATASALAGIQSSLVSGFSGQEVAACSRAMNDMQTAYNNQIASMNQSFANAQALDGRMDAILQAQANCCCENRLALANLNSTILAENCADRQALSDGVRDILASVNKQTETILTQMCNDKIDQKNEQILGLQNQLNMASLAASQAAQTQQLEQFIASRTTPTTT